MIDENELPEGTLERAKMLADLLITYVTDEKIPNGINGIYESLRQTFMVDQTLKEFLPKFVLDCWKFDNFINLCEDKMYFLGSNPQELIARHFAPLINYLEEQNRTPGDEAISDTLKTLNAETVHVVWTKAVNRRNDDPEGAITSARTLLEVVMKRILEKMGADYSDKDDLPKLYRRVNKKLHLAPSHHTEEPIKAILGSAINLVNGIGTLRNRMSDSHDNKVRPTQRHAALAVNVAGAVAAFLVETHQKRREGD